MCYIWPMPMDFGEAAVAVAALADELRGRIYAFVRAQARPVSRDEVATHLGISRGLAAFHLDKLIAAGWLTASYARPPGRSGRGAGRTSKYYQPSERQVELSVPTRRYDVVARILLAALLEARAAERPQDAARRIAWQRGEQLGEKMRRARRLRPPGAERALAICKEILAGYGFEPYQDGTGGIALNNCPFHALAEEAPDVVCPITQSLIEGVLRGLGNKTVEIVAVGRGRGCCVDLRPSRATS